MNPRCHLCRADDDLPVVLDLGLQPPGERLLEPYELGDTEPLQPLRLGFCPRCRTLQRADALVEGFPPSDALAGLAGLDSLERSLPALKASLESRGAAALHVPDVVALSGVRLFEVLDPRIALLPTIGRLQEALHQHDLEAFQVERCPAAPGLVRVFVGHRGAFPVGQTVAERIGLETDRRLDTLAFWECLGGRIRAFRDRLRAEIRSIRDAGQRLCGFGVSPCGSLLLNHCGLGREGYDAVDFVLDPTGQAVGKLTPGSHLAILPAEELEKRFIKCVLLLDPSLEPEALHRTEAWRGRGGRILDPWALLRSA